MTCVTCRDTTQPIGFITVAMAISRLTMDRPLLLPALFASSDFYLVLLKLFTKTLSVLTSISKEQMVAELNLEVRFLKRV